MDTQDDPSLTLPLSDSDKDDSDKGGEDKEWVVEDITCKRILDNGEVQYEVKWEGYDSPTWEPEANVQHSADLVAQYEERAKAEMEKKKKARKGRKKPSSSPRGQSASKRKIEKGKAEGKKKTPLPKSPAKRSPKKTSRNLSGFENGLKAEKIIGASDANGDLMFMMKWEGLDRSESTLVRAKEANLKCPQVVIAFYEERVVFEI